MSLNFKNVTIVFAVVAVLLAASGGIYFVASGGLERAELIYHGNGGYIEGEEDNVTYEHIVWGVDFQNPGYVLKGWNTKADGTGTEYKVGEYLSYDKDVHIYAEWADYAEYNSICVTSYSNESQIPVNVNVTCGTETTELTWYTYVLTTESVAYMTLESDYVGWKLTTDGSNGFLADLSDSLGNGYCVVIYAEGATDLNVVGDKMYMDVSNNVSIRITIFDYTTDDVQ